MYEDEPFYKSAILVPYFHDKENKKLTIYTSMEIKEEDLAN